MTTLAIHPGALGDVVLLGHLLRAMSGEVTLVAGGEKARLLAGLGIVARAMDFDVLPMHELLGESPPQQCRLPALLGKHQRVVTCFASGQGDFATRLRLLTAAEHYALLPIRPPADTSAHLVQLWCETMGLTFDANPAPWPVPPQWRSHPAQPGKPYAIIHPGSGGRAKCWPIDRFLETARQLQARHHLTPLFVLGPVELEQWRPDARQELQRQFATVAAPPLADLAGLLAGASLYVGNDAGVAHLSAAVGAATIAIFGPTSPRHFAPLGRRVQSVHQAQLEDVTVAHVLQAADRLLA